eukprot:CAMPEP_0175062334 /NCGR_PEP_ID=MMETSP0052_2-20121109/14112_1 /TAXON_ID=51329 ORGANISM="Polytomella parva, Strain SAG 63-3" /NCGR_SAMPLE_ID=MMETSP0052_2 /ASSEMBLY_ACC=CAM_ASM_000194 /LENGTH=118 /DNA_ID=CAMNT_0016328347 /DNA_START=300 /DNA_END=656 /DNA_ORIENTATION=-
MSTFEKLYWGLGVTGLSLVLFSNASPLPEGKKDDKNNKDAQLAIKKASEELHARRVKIMRAHIAGKSFVDEDSPFEGMTPQEITTFLKECGLRDDSDDPFDGMSPEEIDEYARLHGLN